MKHARQRKTMLGSWIVMIASILVSAAAGADGALLRTNFQSFTTGSYGGYAGIWYLNLDPTLGLGRNAIEDVDYTSNLVVYPSSFPNNTTVRWRVPNRPPTKAGVYGYLLLHYGNYQQSSVQSAITPRPLTGITDLTTQTAFTYSGQYNRHDEAGILHEMWLTSEARGNGQSVDEYAKFELGCFLRTARTTVAYMNRSTQVGTYHDGIREWTIAVDYTLQVPFIMLRPTDRADVVGEVMWVGIFRYLMQKGILTGGEFFNGLAVGVEPRQGQGSVTFDRFEVRYAGAP
ncbi:hypothetical protein [Roseomonas sp. BN140053]|uniref:hypothetical protein n=1 Tax=Roseomonas sp. BN140053 TaxID=3391898 RepID=UPI0039EB8618